MTNEERIRGLIKGSIYRAIQESLGAVIVLVIFTGMLQNSEVGSAMFYGCLQILIGTGFIVGVVWSHALSYQLLHSHPANEIGFWREAFHSQARLLRLVPYWYCTPIGVGAVVLIAPLALIEPVPFMLVIGLFVVVFAGVVWLNRKVAVSIDDSARQLTE